MTESFEIDTFGERNICIGGIGRLFYESGYPISMSIANFKKVNIECSIYHIAKECLNNGWSAKTTFNKLKADFEEDIENTDFDEKALEAFCNADYDQQCAMIHEYLFKGNRELANAKMAEILALDIERKYLKF